MTSAPRRRNKPIPAVDIVIESPLWARGRGIKTMLRRAIPIQVASDQRVDLALEIGDTGQHIEVVGQAPLLESVSGPLKTT